MEMYKNMKRKGDVVVKGEVGVKEVENEEQMRKLIEDVEEIKKKIEDFCKRNLNRWKSRKFIVVLVFGFAYPIMNHIGISIPAEAVYIIVSYLLGQSAVDLVEKHKIGRG